MKTQWCLTSRICVVLSAIAVAVAASAEQTAEDAAKEKPAPAKEPSSGEKVTGFPQPSKPKARAPAADEVWE